MRAEREQASSTASSPKTAIANNLNQFRREKELLEQQLREALAELPEEKKVEELLLLFQDRAQGRPRDRHDRAGAGPGPVLRAAPDPMTVTGNFHEIATFFDALGRMRADRERERHPPRYAEGREREDRAEREVPRDRLHVRGDGQPRPGRRRSAGGRHEPRPLLVLAAALAAVRRLPEAPPAGTGARGRRSASAAPRRGRSPGRRRRSGRIRPSASATRSAATSPRSASERRAHHPLRHAARRVRARGSTRRGRDRARGPRRDGAGAERRRLLRPSPRRCIGKNGGTVAAVRSGEVVIAEWAVRADGTRDRTQTVIASRARRR